MIKALFLFLFCLTHLNAKVDPPNYDFSTDTLSDFVPAKKISEIEKKYGKPEVMKNKGGKKMLRFWVSQIRYKFPIIVQSQNDEVLDMFARLPSYFLHDIFHHSLIKRWGKQNIYKRVDEEAYYKWDNSDYEMHYSASCTITCFPIYFSAADKKRAGFSTLHDQMQKSQN